MLDLNNIDLAGWAENPNVAVQIANAIEVASWKKSPFEPIAGSSSERGVRTFRVEKAAPFRPRLKAALQGSGVVGNADFETNLDNLEILCQTIYPKVVGNSLKSEIEFYSAMQNIDFLKEAIDSLTLWDSQLRDRNIIAALVNDFTNCVVADATAGYKNTANDKSVVAATKKIQAGDTMNVATIRRAIFMARTGLLYNDAQAFPIKPSRIESTTIQGIRVEFANYLILLDSYQIEQLKADPEWKQMQQVGERGDKNNIFTGFVGLIDNCPVLDMGVWTKLDIGLPSSELSDEDFKQYINKENSQNIVPPSAYADKAPVSIGALVGASAIVCAGSPSPKFYISKREDLGRKTHVGVDRIMAIAKGKYEPIGAVKTPYDNLDFGCIGLFSSKE